MIKKLASSVRLVVQVLKNLLLRPFRVIRNKSNHAMNAGRLVTKFPRLVKKLPKIMKTKPEKREDYFDWGSIYVAKSLVLTVVILLIVIPLLIVFLIAPLCVRWWGVKDFQAGHSDLSSYSGRVRVYYDADEENLKFEGKLKKGKAVEYGEEYYENGRIAYAGEYLDGRYDGEGISYREDGTEAYRGEFADGRYEGLGELISENGDVYSGIFVKGKLTGDGTLIRDGRVWYEGGFDGGLMNGEGKLYHESGAVQYSGLFSAGSSEGIGKEYYENGVLKYNGDFLGGRYHGNGVLYGEDGAKIYAGAFEKGVYSGEGTLFSTDGAVTAGSFSNGKLVGSAIRTYPNGTTYEGTFNGELPHGVGTLTDLLGSFTYSGSFLDGDPDLPALLQTEVSAVGEMFAGGLCTRVEADGFYLVHEGYGLVLKCRFATADQAACVAEIACVPLSDAGKRITASKQITAPTADAVYQAEREIPAWIAQYYGIDAESVVCYAAVYGTTSAVYHWVDSQTGTLLVKSAEQELPPAVDEPSPSEEDAMEDIRDIFEEFGLDISDFGSLGF